MDSTIEVFCCYAREDALILQRLEKQLKALRRQGLIDVWNDQLISPGTDWEKEISAHLDTAHIILLLISPDFMDSEYCYSVEMHKAMERHDSGTARVIPVILRPVYWRAAPFGNLQALPRNALPITSAEWHDQDDAFFDVAEGVRTIAEEMQIDFSLADILSKKGNGLQISERARKIISFAREEANHFHHNYIGTQHLLLGIFHSGEGMVPYLYEKQPIKISEIQEVVKLILRGQSKVKPGKIDFSGAGKETIEEAIDIAHRLHHTIIDPEHLLLGLLNFNDSTSAAILVSIGYDTLAIRLQLFQKLGLPLPDQGRLQPLVQQIQKIAKAKEVAIQRQEYEKAAQFHDQETQLTASLFSL